MTTVAEEHEFTEWCEKVFSRVSGKSVQNDSASTVLTTLYGNTHNRGIRFLKLFLEDRGHHCRVFVPALTDDALVAHYRKYRPRFCGISVALPSDIPRAQALARRIRSETNGATKTCLGGFALLTFPQKTFDLLLSDVVLTDPKGDEIAAENRKKTPNLKLLLISGYLDNEFGDFLLDRDVPFLQKPFSSATLIEKVCSVVSAQAS